MRRISIHCLRPRAAFSALLLSLLLAKESGAQNDAAPEEPSTDDATLPPDVVEEEVEPTEEKPVPVQEDDGSQEGTGDEVQETPATDEDGTEGEEAATLEVAEPDDEAGSAGEQAPTDAQESDKASDEAPADDASPLDEPGAEFFDEDEEFEFEAVAEVEAPPREPTRRTMDKEQLTRIPGTRGDALRAIEVMPGVARTDFAANGGPPILRGGSSWESLVLLDGAQVPLIYHFGGLTSFFNSHLLESVNLYPGNYSARYGRAAGGVVEARVRDPKNDGFHALVELSAIDSFALAEGPIAKKTSVALAARRSNIDFFFDSFVPEGSYSVLAAPVYWDYQAIVAHQFDEKNKLRVLTYGSQDSLELYFSDSATDDPALSGGIDARMGFHRAQIELESKFSKTVEQNLMVSVGPSFADQKLGQLDSRFRFFDVNARAEWSIFASKAVRIDTGADLVMFGGRGEYEGPAPSTGEGEPGGSTLASETYYRVEEKSLTPTRPGAFLEASLRPIDEWLLVPGVRADYTFDGQDWTVDPRFSTRFEVAPQTTLKAGVGQYSQPPEYYELIEDIANPDVKPFRTLQTSVGVEQKLGEKVKVDVEGFYKRWYDRIVGTEGGAPPGLVNDGRGRALGLEVLFDVRLSEKTQAFLAYTLQRSERQDREDPWRLFDYDQTHNVSLTANYDFGKGWLAGARFRYVSGNPMTEVEGAVYDASTDTYRALFGEVNGGRDPAFHQLDVRVEKLWELGPVGLTTFLEVLNAYNAKNQSGRSYSYDYSQSEGAIGMPIFPNIGIRGEL